MCNFFVAPGNGQALLGMLDIKSLTILSISCNTIGTKREYKDKNYSTNSHSLYYAGSKQCCANTGLERTCTRANSNAYFHTNTGSNSNLNKGNAFTLTVKK